MAAKNALQEAINKALSEHKLLIAPPAQHELTVNPISVGNIYIDSITGIGGLPRGRIVECYGPPSSGKTTTALQVHRTAQQNGLVSVFFDFEDSFDQEYAESLGIDTEDSTFLLANPESLEQGFNVARKLINTGQVAVMTFDSVAGMVTERENEIDTGEAGGAMLKAQVMAQGLRQMKAGLRRNDVCAIFLNHLQEKIDTSPMGKQLAKRGIKQKTTPGGNALKFYASLRLEFQQVGNIRTEEENVLTLATEKTVTSTKVKVTAAKNKVGKPFGTCEVRVRYGKGFSQPYSVLGVLVAHGQIKKKTGGIYEIPQALAPDSYIDGGFLEPMTIRGEDNILVEMENDSGWVERLTAVANDVISGGPLEFASADELLDSDPDGVLAQKELAAEGIEVSEEDDGATVDDSAG